MDSTAKAYNDTMLVEREAQRAGTKRANFTPELIQEGGSLSETEAALRTARDASAKVAYTEIRKPLQEQTGLANKLAVFNQDFALHRDFRNRYCTTAHLRRKGYASSRQKHFLGSTQHNFAAE